MIRPPGSNASTAPRTRSQPSTSSLRLRAAAAAPLVGQGVVPAKSAGRGPGVGARPLGVGALDGGCFRERPGTDGPLVSYWRYEGLFMSVKRLSTAVGFPDEAATLGGVRYDEI